MLLKLRRSGLASRIIAWSFVPTAIILAAVAFVTFYAYQQVTQDLVVERNQELARLSAGQVAAGLTEYSELLDSTARLDGIPRTDHQTQAIALNRAANTLVVFDGGVVILDNLGKVVATEPGRPEIMGQDWSNRSYFRQIVRGSRPAFSDILPDGPGGSSAIAVSVPIVGGRGEMLGVLVGMFRLDATAVSAFYGGIVRLRIGGSASYLVDSSGRVIYHTDAGRTGENLSGQVVVQKVLAGEVGNLRTQDLNGRAILAGYAPVPGTPWGLVTEESWAALMRSSQGYRNFLLFLLALGIVVPVVVLAIGIRRITAPIHELISAAQEVAGGKFDQRITAETGDELADLADQFNLMSVQLEGSYAHLEQRVADRTKELAALNAIAAVVSQSLDLEEVLADALEKTVEVTGLETGAAFSLEESSTSDGGSSHCLVLRANHESSPQLVRVCERLPLKDSLAATAAETGRPVTSRIADYPEGELRDALASAGQQQIVSVPLMAKGKLIGALNLGTSFPRTFSQDEMSLLAGIGQQVGLALENARLYKKAEEVAAAAERSRLARDLHDAVTQTLFSASLISEVLPKLWDRNPTEARRRLEELRQLTRGALAEMRTLLLELRPTALVEVPFGDLLRQLCESTQGRARLPVTLTVEGQRLLPADVQVVLYRIAQEALNNVAKHSGASEATVSLRYLVSAPLADSDPTPATPLQDGKANGGPTLLAVGEGVELCIGDNGRGFDPTTVPPDHLGLGIMRERAVAIGASVSIDSEPGRGTEVWVVWRNNGSVKA